MKVEQLMTPDPLTVAPQTPVAEIARLLLEHRINGVPVIDREGRMLGIVTAGDLMYRAADEQLEPRTSIWKENFYQSVFRRHPEETDKDQGRTAMEVMTRDVHSVEPDTDIVMAARLLVDFEIISLPVLQSGRVVGMLSRHDLLKWIAKHPEGENLYIEERSHLQNLVTGAPENR
ncbi:CBS domain-containing protein [Acidithiobacillus sp.]|uniref:CBS domain-containing protein n=1 Tax=Acidithiobacillus sp. TaxID=1872118 RepID=UPI003D060B9E